MSGITPLSMIPARKGARSRAEIPADVLLRLNRGEAETVNLVEWLAVDQRVLLGHFLAASGRMHYEGPILVRLGHLKKETVNTINEGIGAGLLALQKAYQDEALLPLLVSHPSDVVRGWAPYLIGQDADRSLEEMLADIRPFAADPHFGVREVAWLAVRPRLAEELSRSLRLLAAWSLSPDENIRRFASEATRPRGVWCAHIPALKDEPEQALGLLEPLRADPAKYVRDSVANWLNDASKTRPDFVRQLCQRWETESPAKETAYIVKKALRTIGQ